MSDYLSDLVLNDHRAYLMQGDFTSEEIDSGISHLKDVAVRMVEKLKANNINVGQVIGIGSSAFVFELLDNPNDVLKVYRKPYEPDAKVRHNYNEHHSLKVESDRLINASKVCQEFDLPLIFPEFKEVNYELGFIRMEKKSGEEATQRNVTLDDLTNVERILRACDLYPGDVELMVDNKGNLFFYDIAGFIDLNRINENEWGSIDSVLLRLIGRS